MAYISWKTPRDISFVFAYCLKTNGSGYSFQMEKILILQRLKANVKTS